MNKYYSLKKYSFKESFINTKKTLEDQGRKQVEVLKALKPQENQEAAETDQNVLENMVKFNNKSKSKTKEGKDKNKMLLIA